MRIVQILPELHEGGVERGTVELSRELVKKGFESIVISNGGKLVIQLEQEGGKHIQFDVCSKNPLTSFSRIFALKKLISKIKPDVIHVRSRIPAWLIYFANKNLKIPTVSTVHGLNSVSKYSQIMTKSDRVICVSEVVRDYIIKHYTPNKEKITVIQRGVDLKKFNPQTIDKKFIKEFKDKYNLNDKYIITSVGRITWLKDYETFIEAISISKKNIPNIMGVIVGGAREDKARYFEELKELTKKFNVSENIIFTGSQTNMPEIYNLSNIVVNASIKMGNVARTVTEALAMDTPVIATTYKGLNNIVVDNKNGYIIKVQDPKDLSNKISTAYKNKFVNIRENLNENFTLDCLVESTVNVYINLKESKVL